MPNAAIKKIKSALKDRKRPNWKLVVFAILAFVLIFAILLQTNRQLNDTKIENETKSQNDLERIDLTINQQRFVTEIARTDTQKQLGLGGRPSLAENQAMLFVYDRPGDYGFWMKDTKIPLDMIWIAANKKIVHIEHDVQPDSYPKTFSSPTEAQYVLELKGGEAARRGIEVGDSVSF